MPDLAAQYLDWCAAVNVAANTIASRRRTLRTLPDAGSASREDVEAWWESRADLSPGTRAVDLSNLRAFYRWCQRRDLRADDPTVRLDAPSRVSGLDRL